MTRRGLLLGAVLFTAGIILPVHAVELLFGPTLNMNPFGPTPLAGQVELVVDEPVRVRLTIRHQGDERIVELPALAEHHRIPLLGLRPDRSYTVDVELLPGGLVASLLATTPALPADFPTLVTNVSDPDDMEPGYTLLDCFFRGPGDPRLGYTMIVDDRGEVVWYTSTCMRAARQVPNGDLLFRENADARQMTMLGPSTRRAPLQDPGAGLHHDLIRTPHGTYLSLTYRAAEVADFPTSETDPAAPRQATVVRDEPVVEFFPDGSLRKQWPLLSLLDPMRIAYDSLDPTSDGVDWAHTNAVTYRVEDDSIIVSARHQDAVFSFARATGELQWILGPHDNWSGRFRRYLLDPLGTPFRWQFHQHAPMWTGSGGLLLFDNGNHRASPFDGTVPRTDEQSFSRAVEYEIDPVNLQVRQVWEYGENTAERLYASFISDADWQPVTGNRLITFGGVSHVEGVSSADLGLGATHARIVETTDDLSAEPVFDLTVFDPTGGRIAIYRSERIADLYPTDAVLPPNGVESSLRLDRPGGDLELSWLPSATDSGHTAAGYYIVYASTVASEGFFIEESTAHTAVTPPEPPSTLRFYRIVAANSSGTSGDEPRLAE